MNVLFQPLANIACTGQVQGFARTFEESAPTTGSASGGFVCQVLHLPVTPAVGPPHHSRTVQLLQVRSQEFRREDE